MRISSIEYKLQIRDFLNRSLTIDFQIVIIIFPVLFGIYKILYSKHYTSTNQLTSSASNLFTNQKIISSSLQQNLPGLSSEPTEISWQTFDQIFSDQPETKQAAFQLTGQDISLPNISKFDGFTNQTNNLADNLTHKTYNVSNFFGKRKNNKKHIFEEYSYNTSVKRIDFCNGLMTSPINTNLYKKQKNLYVGLVNNILTAKINPSKFQLGHNWLNIVSKKIHYLPQIVQTKSIKYNPGMPDILMTKNVSHWKNKTDQIETWNKKIENSANYLNLDELPIKLDGIFTENRIFFDKKLVAKQPASQAYSKQKSTIFPKKTEFNKFDILKFKPYNIKNTYFRLSFFKLSPKKQKFTTVIKNSLFLKGVKNISICEHSVFKYNTATGHFQSKDLELKQVLLKTNKSKKSEHLEQLLKNYGLNKNLTCLASSGTSYLPQPAKQAGTKYLTKGESLKGLSETAVSGKNFQNLFSSHKEVSEILSFYSKKPLKALELLLLLEEFVVVNKTKEFTPRLMSGYTTPDNSNIYNLSQLKTFPNISTSKPRYAKHSSANYNNFLSQTLMPSKTTRPAVNSTLQVLGTTACKSEQNVLNFELLSKPVNYSNLDKSIYNGLSSFQNKVTNELEINNPVETKKLVKQLLYSDNPLSDRQQSFFGNSSIKSKQKDKAFVKNRSLSNSKSNTSKADDFVPGVSSSMTGLNNSPIKTNWWSGKPNSSYEVQEVIPYRVPLFIKNKSEKITTTALYPKNRTRLVTPENKTSIKYLTICPASEIFSRSRSAYIIYLNELDWDAFLKKLETSNKLDIKNIFPIKSFYQPNKLSAKRVISLPILWPLNQLDFKHEFIFSHNICTVAEPLICGAHGSEYLEQDIQTDSNTSEQKLVTFSVPNSPLLETWEQSDTQYKKVILKDQYLPYSQKLSKQKLSAQFLFGQSYKKKYSTYKNKKDNLSLLSSTDNSVVSVPIYDNKLTKFSELFYEPLEPISYDSWLVITQFSIGFFLIRIFQNILKKYEQEMKYVISNLLENKDSNSGQSNSEQNSLDSQFRIIKTIKKNFDSIAGIDAILPELGEIIWFLRNSGRSFKTGKTIPQGILLTGPPGTGKTLLVQAIAGEAEVPVLIESASSLHQSGPAINGSDRLKNLFSKAREIAPCIIFIDEIDTFGKARSAMMENPVLTNPILDSIYPNNHVALDTFTPFGNFNLIPKPVNLTNRSNIFDGSGDPSSNNQFSGFYKKKINQEKSNLLLQFLIELDGVATNKKVLVFGATNRPQILDPALTRPGRFNKILQLKLPNKQKRIEIVKLYSNNIGVEKNISWEYIANLTIGLSAADLASAINQSSMQAIQAETIHTIQTIEYGIQSITGCSSQKNKLKSFSGLKQQTFFTLHTKQGTVKLQQFLFINRLAYYQAGKLVVHTLLKKHPGIISIRLWPNLKSHRYHLMHGILEKEFSQMYRRVELESRIIGFYAGKAGEFINLFSTIKQKKNQISRIRSWSSKARPTTYEIPAKPVPVLLVPVKIEMQLKTGLYSWQSDLGIQDISFASWLAELMVNKWFLYSKKISLQNFNQLDKHYNTEKISNLGIFYFLQKKSNSIETGIHKTKYLIKENSQNWVTKLWLQKQVTKKLEFSYSTKNDWYKIYGGDHDANENTRYLSADTYYHNNTYLKNLNSCKFRYTGILFKNKISSSAIINWNDISSLNRDYIYHNLLLTCFNKAILIIDQNRELLDFFATSLLQNETLREYEILKIIKIFYKNFRDF